MIDVQRAGVSGMVFVVGTRLTCDRAGGSRAGTGRARRRAAPTEDEGRRLRGPAAPGHRPGAHVGPGERHRRRPGQAEHLVRRGRVRGASGRPTNAGHDLDADLRRLRLVLDRLRRRRSRTITWSSGWAPARTTASGAWAMATASTSRSTAARASRRSGWRAPSTSPRS